MKRIAALLLIVLLTAGMVTPAFAVGTEKPEYCELIDTVVALLLDRASARVPAEYQYYAVLFRPGVNDNVLILFSKDQTIPISCNDFYSISWSSVNPDTFPSPSKHTNSLNFSLNGRNICISLFGYAYYYPYYINDRSTAGFENMHAMGSTDFIINVGGSFDPGVDTAVLESLIARAESENPSDYTASTWSVVQSVLYNARELLEGSYTQADVDAMCARLQAALDGLETILLPDTTELVGMLDEARAIDDIGYTAFTWSRLQTAIVNGDSLLMRPVYTVSEVRVVTTDLRVGIDGLMLAAPSSSGNSAILTGDVGAHLSLFSDIFLANGTVALSQVIGIFTLILAFRFIPRILKHFLR